MSLLVNVYTRVDGQFAWVEVEHPGEELFGFEVCRRQLWGHAALVATLLPSLAEGDIYAEDEDSLRRLESDAHLVLTYLDEIAAETRFAATFVEWRVRNLLRAAGYARALGGGVWIG